MKTNTTIWTQLPDSDYHFMDASGNVFISSPDSHGLSMMIIGIVVAIGIMSPFLIGLSFCMVGGLK